MASPARPDVFGDKRPDRELAVPSFARGLDSTPVIDDSVAQRIVEVAASFPGIIAARLCRTLHRDPSTPPETAVVAASVQTEAAPVGPGRTYPLLQRNHVSYVLQVFEGQPCGAGTLRAVEKFSEIAATALNYAEIQQSAEDFAAILEATRILNSTLDLPELLRIILQLSTRLCGADRGTVFLVDKTKDEIWSLRGLGLEKHEIRIPMSKGIAGWVACRGESVRVDDAASDSRFDPDVDRDLGYHTKQLLALPIRNKGCEIVGVLELLNKKSGPFTEGDENALTHFSVYIALALENSRLHGESLIKQRMENDLALARKVQRGLLPENLPALEGFDVGVAYAPSLMVGGDYYDFMRLRPDSLLLVIADVEGKGVASALMMANLHASLHTLAAHVHSIECVVKSVNEMILSDTRERKLLSMFVAVIDEQRRVLHYINAGLVPPVIVRGDGEILQLTEGGFVLGAFSDALYRRGRVQLRSGDVFVAYTDGITEAMDAEGEMYGLDRLVELIRKQCSLPAKQIVDNVLSDVDRFSFQGLNEDDRVVLLLKLS
jgi:phosphoserine phosphatase RsbU/P